MANQFRTAVLLPPVTDPDFARGELACSVDGVPLDVKPVAKTDTEIEYIFPQDSTVFVSLVHIDDAGNRSAPSEREFIITDDVPPATPGELGLRKIEEI